MKVKSTDFIDNSGGYTTVDHDFGAGATGGGGTGYNGGIWFGNLITIDADGTIDEVVYAMAVNKAGINAVPVIYANNAGAAGAVLAQGPQVNDCVIGDNVLPLTTPLEVTAGDELWIGNYQANTGGLQALTMPGPGSSYFIDNLPVNDPGGGLTGWSSCHRIFGRGTTQVYVSGKRFKLPFFFTAPPEASETLAIIVADEAFTIPADFAGDQIVAVGNNPTSAFVITLKKNGEAIGTISINTSGVTTLATTGGVGQAVGVGDVLTYVAQAGVDATLADVAAMLWGEIV